MALRGSNILRQYHSFKRQNEGLVQTFLWRRLDRLEEVPRTEDLGPVGEKEGEVLANMETRGCGEKGGNCNAFILSRLSRPLCPSWECLPAEVSWSGLSKPPAHLNAINRIFKSAHTVSVHLIISQQEFTVHLLPDAVWSHG